MRKLKQRLFSLLLCAAMLFSLCAPAAAEDTGKYLTWDETQEKLVEANIPSSITEIKIGITTLNSTTTDGWYIVRSSVEIGSRVTVTGDVHLILEDGCNLTVNKGIDVGKGNSLTIYGQRLGTGELTATGDRNNAGIGGGWDGAGGKITINGGTVNATSNSYIYGSGAGIGGGWRGDGGEITINGGTVTAVSTYGAGIGGGWQGAGGKIAVNGGDVTATGGMDSADDAGGPGGTGIGGGMYGAGGEITISGNAKVVVNSRGNGASIGGGGGSKGGTAGGDGGTIIISGNADVTATSDHGGAGIGGGWRGDGGTITISGNAKVTATSNEDGAGIGGGDGGAGGEITINGGEVTATGSAGIDGDTITITDGEVTATGSSYGIYGGSGVSLTGGTVKASSSGGMDAGIYSDGDINVTAGEVTANGPEYGIYGRGTITITGGTVMVSSTTGSFSGYGIYCGDAVAISGGTVTASGTGNYYGCGIYCNSTVTISSGTVTASGTSNSSGYGIYGGKTVTISSGTVTASGTNNNNDRGYGIYGGSTVTISGGTVTATGTSDSGGGISSSDGGTFSTGTNGSAFIVASSIDDQSGKDQGQWSGVIFVGAEDGKVYGSEITLATGATIPKDKTLEIEAGKTLIIGEDVTLTNNGSITGNGTIINNGTIKGNAIDSSVTTHTGKTAWSSDASDHWHECAVEGCNQNHQFNKAAHTPGDWVIDKAATSTEAGQRHKACTVCGYVTATETIPATGGGSGGGGGGSYTPPTTPTYPPTVEKPGEGGEAPAISPSKPEKGDTVTVTPNPDEGYEVDKITVTDKNGKPVEVTKKPDGTYTFKQPGGKVKIEVSYKEVNTPWNNPFADVPKDAWYYEAVRFVCERGLMNGYADGRFAPEDTLSRAQLAQILFNKEGQPAGSGQSDFTDVAGEAWYSAAVRWAADQGIVGGYGDGTFGPNAPITREQLAVMLWRYVGSPAATDKELHFNDESEISGFALEALRWAVENGILNGYGDGQLGPQGQATRAQVVQMLKNFIENQGEDT